MINDEENAQSGRAACPRLSMSVAFEQRRQAALPDCEISFTMLIGKRIAKVKFS